MNQSLRPSDFAPAFGRAVAAVFCAPEGLPFRVGDGYGLKCGSLRYVDREGSRIALRAMAHLSDDETVARMGHPDLDLATQPMKPHEGTRHPAAAPLNSFLRMVRLVTILPMCGCGFGRKHFGVSPSS
jgi:hypothetical protein